MNKFAKVQVTAKAQYLPEESSAESSRYVWSYEIFIDNEGEEIVQLLNRHWKITDLSGRIEEVRGPGVIGLQPIIKPNKQFAYSSYCQLSTPQGVMEGEYEMQTLNDVRFMVQIPKFVLASPESVSAGFRSRLH